MSIKFTSVVLASLLLAGCFKSSMTFIMKTSTWEFFEQNCPADNVDNCITDVEKHIDTCFNDQLAYRTVELESDEQKCENNIALINDMEQCFAMEINQNYWEGIDLPATFYEQINMKRAEKGKAPIPYPCDRRAE